ncbi:MAG: hypothetical protein GY851_21625 [bacterium]|nr:hypothetical protein [bacterium]
MKTADEIDIVEAYHDYEPPVPVEHVVRDLLRCVPAEYLQGLGAVILTDAAGKSRHERRASTHSRGRKVGLSDCLGYYEQAWNGEQASITLHMDVLLPRSERGRTWFARLRAKLIRPWWLRSRIGHTLYHELGHHIHTTQKPEHRERENVADSWKWPLFFRMFKRRWYLAVLFGLGYVMSSAFWLAVPRYLRAMGNMKHEMAENRADRSHKEARRKSERRHKRKRKHH